MTCFSDEPKEVKKTPTKRTARALKQPNIKDAFGKSKTKAKSDRKRG